MKLRTVVAILVALAVLGILAAIAIPSFVGYTAMMKNACGALRPAACAIPAWWHPRSREPVTIVPGTDDALALRCLLELVPQRTLEECAPPLLFQIELHAPPGTRLDLAGYEGDDCTTDQEGTCRLSRALHYGQPLSFFYVGAEREVLSPATGYSLDDVLRGPIKLQLVDRVQRQLEIFVRDAAGNPLTDVALALEATTPEGGSVLTMEARTDLRGLASVTHRAPLIALRVKATRGEQTRTQRYQREGGADSVAGPLELTWDAPNVARCGLQADIERVLSALDLAPAGQRIRVGSDGQLQPLRGFSAEESARIGPYAVEVETPCQPQELVVEGAPGDSDQPKPKRAENY